MPLHLAMKRFYCTRNLNFIKFTEKGTCGIIQLDRPKALNAINSEMFKSLYSLLRELEKKKSHVIFKGHEKAFSAGGDVKDVLSKDFDGSIFKYQMRNFELVHTYKIPYISLMTGITFGGCAPFAVAPKNHRVVTEKTVFSMPESTIGYFNDAGASYFLSRLKNNLGFYMSLASARIYGGDIRRIGLADYFVLSERLEELSKSLAECKNQQEIEKILSKFASEPKDSRLEGILPNIDKCFDGDTVEEIIDNLHLDGSEWAMDTVKILNKLSPTSLKVCHREHTLGKKMSLRDCLKMEFRMACHHAAGSDLHEGVRALLIDKDNKPNYKPSTLHDVEEEHIERFMKPLSNGDELTFEER